MWGELALGGVRMLYLNEKNLKDPKNIQTEFLLWNLSLKAQLYCVRLKLDVVTDDQHMAKSMRTPRGDN